MTTVYFSILRRPTDPKRMFALYRPSENRDVYLRSRSGEDIRLETEKPEVYLR